MPIINIGILPDYTPVYRENVYFCRIVRGKIRIYDRIIIAMKFIKYIKKKEGYFMKKTSMSYIMTFAGIIFAIGAIVGVVTPLIISGTLNASQFGIIFFMYLVVVGITIYPLFTKISGHIAEKTLKKLDNMEFDEQNTFYAGTSILSIDFDRGKLAYVSFFNPKELQIADVSGVDRVKSGYVKGPLGGTTCVYFEFYYKNKRYRFATFASNHAYMIKSQEVQTAISKADMYSEMLENAAKMRR